jgi:hypothetical protein
MQIRSVGAEMFHADDGQIGMTKLTVAFRTLRKRLKDNSFVAVGNVVFITTPLFQGMLVFVHIPLISSSSPRIQHKRVC